MENYLEHAIVALDVGDVDLLVALWKETAVFPSSLRDTVREYITRSLPDLANKHQLKHSGEDFSTFVREIYDAYVLKNILCDASKAQLSVYVRDGGWLRAESVASQIEELPKEHAYFTNEDFALDLGKTFYWLLQRGKGKVYSGACLHQISKKLSYGVLSSFLKGFVEVLVQERNFVLLDDMFYMLRINDFRNMDYEDLTKKFKNHKELFFDYWKHCVNKNLATDEEDIFEDKYHFLDFQSMDAKEKLRYLAVVISHPHCTDETKRKLARYVSNYRKFIKLSATEFELFLDFPYDKVFHHSLLYYLLKRRTVRGCDEIKDLAKRLIEKFGYDNQFDIHIVRKENFQNKVRKLTEQKPLDDDFQGNDSSDSSYSDLEESSASEEYGSDTTESASSEEEY